MPVTIQNIADHVGLSKQAVSCALNGKRGQVSEATRQTVLEAAKEMGYRPNWRARSFARQQSGTVGLVYGRPANYVEHSQVVSALVQQLAAAGRELMLIPAMGPVEEWGHKLHDGRVDGVLITHPMPQDLDTFVAEHRVPAVLLNLRSPMAVPQVSFDDAHGTRLAMDHLLGLGHRRIAYFCAPKFHGEHYSNEERRTAYAAAMVDAKLEEDIRIACDLYEDFACSFASADPTKRPTALLVYNDKDAIYLMQALLHYGVRVPDHVSLMGFNDDAAARMSFPPLTTIASPGQALAEAALGELMPQIQQAEASKPDAVPIVLRKP